jgi:isochorismate synthase
MKLPEQHTHRLIDGLTRSPFSFALYRLPWTDECYFVLQTSGGADTLKDISELNGRKGFVIAPFRQTEEHPLVLIRPEVTAYDWPEITQAISHIENADEILTAKAPQTNVLPTLNEQERYDRYYAAFRRFIEPLEKGKFQKLVLSRPAFCPTNDTLSPLEIFVKACNAYPRMMIYLCHTPVTGTWVGSTPEILLSGQAQNWKTVALAGTLPIENDVEPTEWSAKNQQEQALVAEYVRKIVKKHGRKMTEKGPYTARAGQLVHLKTDFHFQLKETGFLGDLLKELHPTPAVCGLPKAEAYAFIPENEGYERKYYSGFIGWLEPDGQTDLYVNLRCMEIHEEEATLYAGGGILASSEMASELEETKEKMKTMINIL